MTSCAEVERTVIALRDLRNRSAAIIDTVIAGETFVVTRNGTAVAELRPLSGPQRTRVPLAEIAAQIAAGRIDAAAFRTDLDRVVNLSL